MNKRLVFGMLTAAGMLLTTSCSNDDLDVTSLGNEVQVSFSLDLENGIASRAISDGTSVDKLVYAVFDGEGNRITTIDAVDKTVSFPVIEKLTLAKGKTYKIAFWAQDADCSAYTVDKNTMSVAVSYEGGVNNDETRDAFFKTIEFTVTGSTSIDVELKRPFAQVNVGVTEDDWKAAVASGTTIEKSSVVIKNAATSINLLTGAVSGSAEVTYSLSAIPTESLSVDMDGDGTDETYKWLSMSYFLVDDGSADGSAKTTLDGLQFTLNPASGDGITLDKGLANVPVQRNWRTNILGNLLSGEVTFNISIDPIYDGDYVYPDGSAQELAMAAAYGGVVTLDENVALETPLKIAAGQTVVLNLNKHNITPPAGADRTIEIEDGAELVINGTGKIGSLTSEAFAIGVKGGKLTINGGTFYGGNEASCIYLFNSANYEGVRNTGSIEINGGTFKVNSPWNGFYYVLNKQNGAEGNITVKGGTFENYDPAKGDDHDQPSCFVAEGYSSVQSKTTPAPNGTYKVVKNAENATEAEAAIEAANGVVVVDQDLTADSWMVGKNSKLVLKDNATLTGDAAHDQTILVGSSKITTIEGEGTIVAPKNDNMKSAAVWVNRGTLNINGKVALKNAADTHTGSLSAAIYLYSGTVNINDGYFYSYNDIDGGKNPCIYLCGNKYGKCYLNIFGGVFESESETNEFIVNILDSASAANNVVKIYGGTFVGFNPAVGDSGPNITTFVADGYESVQTTYNGKTAWTVQKKS